MAGGPRGPDEPVQACTSCPHKTALCTLCWRVPAIDHLSGSFTRKQGELRNDLPSCHLSYEMKLCQGLIFVFLTEDLCQTFLFLSLL